MQESAELARLMATHWGLEGAAVEPLGGGMNSETWWVRHAGSTYVAKRVPPSGVAALAEGCRVAERLAADHGLTTGRPAATLGGALLAVDAGVALLEHVVGDPLDGEDEEQQRQMAVTLAAVHRPDAVPGAAGTAGFLPWLTPQAPGVDDHPWLPPVIQAVRRESDATTLTWSTLHTDPTPEAFVHDPATGVTGLIDWAGAGPGPVLYDVASAVMYLGGVEAAAPFLTAYAEVGPLGAAELDAHLDALRRFRWVVQAAYFAGRLRAGDLTGLDDDPDDGPDGLPGAGNRKGLADARRGLEALGPVV